MGGEIIPFSSDTNRNNSEMCMTAEEFTKDNPMKMFSVSTGTDPWNVTVLGNMYHVSSVHKDTEGSNGCNFMN